MSVKTREPDVRPVTLVVEDDERLLRARKELFTDVGFVVLGASSYEEGLREFRTGPAVDLVILDLNLDRLAPDDRSGVSLARAIRETKPSPPVIGYSSFFNEEDLVPEDRAMFDAYVPKARLAPRELVTLANEWLELALKYRRSRGHLVARELERLGQKYEIRERDFEILRSFLPGLASAGTKQEAESPDELLRSAGFRVRLIEPGEPRPSVDGDESRIVAPFLLWIRSEADATIAEVSGCPELYQYGHDDDDAIHQLLLLMDGYYQDLHSPQEHEESPRVASLRSFLRHVFG